MPSLMFKEQSYGGTATVNDSDHILADNGSGAVVTSQQLFENILGDFAAIETSPSSRGYYVGNYLILNGFLYRVTAAIAPDDPIVAGTNVEQTTVDKELRRVSYALLSPISPYTGNVRYWKYGAVVCVYVGIGGSFIDGELTTVARGLPVPIHHITISVDDRGGTSDELVRYTVSSSGDLKVCVTGGTDTITSTFLYMTADNAQL